MPLFGFYQAIYFTCHSTAFQTQTKMSTTFVDCIRSPFFIRYIGDQLFTLNSLFPLYYFGRFLYTGTNHQWVEGIQVYTNGGPSPFRRGDNSENTSNMVYNRILVISFRLFIIISIRHILIMLENVGFLIHLS